MISCSWLPPGCSQPLSCLFNQQDWEHHLSPWTASRAMLEPRFMLSIFPLEVVLIPTQRSSSHSLRARQALTADNMLNLMSRQAQVRLAHGAKSLSSDYFSFLLVLQCSSAGLDAPRPSSATLAPNLSHSCKSANGVESSSVWQKISIFPTME